MIFRFILALVLVLLVGACSGPGYYVQAISGQLKLMNSRQDVQSLLDDPATSSELAGHLENADLVKSFAKGALYLPAHGSYSSYVEVEGDALVWNVIATEEFSLEAKKWCFPVAGCVPYRGFFKHQKAQDSAARLRNRGMDVFVSPATAYSSLGWFKDPLLSTMFSGSDIRLAAYLFHELAHQRLYIKGDGMFNEGYASFLEVTGVRLWLESNQRLDELLKWQQLQSAGKDFNRLIVNLRSELGRLYRSDMSEATKRQRKTEILGTISSSYERLRIEKWGGRNYYTHWFEKPVNNARLALYTTYEGSHCAFQELFDQAGGDLQQFHSLAEQKSTLPREERMEWLKQLCSAETARVDFKNSSP